ncbi:hypothetical protein SEUCBS139899_006680 [Sporothrix eucalyptigena]|uniref:Aar2 domain containing protein n=1 Tax=Sporothrix eucalyptigena TaxID=1812306 RepID=A0ABP0BA81_9PEZI
MDINQPGATAPDDEVRRSQLIKDGTQDNVQSLDPTAVNRSNSNCSSKSVLYKIAKPLSKSNSVVSHQSIPFTGAYPIGHLKVVQPADSISEGHESKESGTPATNGRSNGVAYQAPPRQTVWGDAFVLLSIPVDAQVGCDIMALTVKKPTADSFLGFRDLPPGAHFVWLSAPGAMSRQGYWFVTPPEPHGSVVRVKQWDRFNEVLGECASQFEARSLANDISSVYPRLLAYNNSENASNGIAPSLNPAPYRPAYLGPPLHEDDIAVPSAGIWAGLTSCISEEILARITGKKPSSGAGTGPAHTEWMVSTTDTSKGEISMLPQTTGTQLLGSTGSAEFAFYFSKDDLDPYQLLALRDKTMSSNNDQIASVSESTSSSSPPCEGVRVVSDTTERIVTLLEHATPAPSDSDLIGELQFAFLTGTLLSNLSCLEQWWHLVLKVYLRANSLVSQRPELCRMFIQALHYQFLYLERHVAGGFLGHTSSTGTANKDAGATYTAGIVTVPATEGDAGGMGIFEAKTQGAMRLQASLTEFKRHLNKKLLGLGKKASPEEAKAGEAFASLEAALWKYGWDLRSNYVCGELGSNEADNHNRGGRFGDPSDNDDADGEMDYYEEATSRTTGRGHKPHRVHTGLSDSDSDSDQPVLVELDEDGKEVGLVSWD